MAAPLRRALAALALGPVPARGYRAGPLRRSLGGPYRPDPADPRTPPWQLEPRYEARLFGRFGAASGVAAARLWPDPERLRELEAEEREWCPALRDMEAALELRERQEEQRRAERARRVAAALAALPAQMAAWRQRREEAAAARQRGGAAAGGGPRARALQEEQERQRRRQDKRQRRQRRQEEARQALAAAREAAAPAPPPVAP